MWEEEEDEEDVIVIRVPIIRIIQAGLIMSIIVWYILELLK